MRLEVSQSSLLILQMRRLYPREGKGLAPGQTEGQGAKPGLEPGLLVQASFQHGVPHQAHSIV